MDGGLHFLHRGRARLRGRVDLEMNGIPAPGPGEYAPFYGGYVSAVAGSDVLALLRSQMETIRRMVGRLPEREALFRYAEGKWSIKEVLGHLADAERVFGYRALRIGRGDPTPLPPFDENAFVAAADFDNRPLALLLSDLVSIRATTLALLESFTDDAWLREGRVSGATMSLRAMAHIIAGHTEHHVRILEERYGLGSS